MILLLLISAATYVYALIRQEQIESPFVPTPTPTRSALSHSYEAEALYQEGRIAQAINSYERALELEPSNVQAMIPLARLLALEGETSEAVVVAQRATQLAPDSAAAWAVLGMAQDWDGAVGQAIESCSRAVELDPNHAEAHAYLAEAYADAVRWEDAINAGQTAIRLDEQSVDAHRNYGYVLESQGNYWEAASEYDRALQINPNLAHIHISAGRVQRTLGDFESAAASFKRAVEIEPDNVEATTELGWSYHLMSQFTEAETHLERAVELDGDYAAAFGRLAINYWARRNYEDAIPNFERAIELSTIDGRWASSEFFMTEQDTGADIEGPSTKTVLRGAFTAGEDRGRGILRARLKPAFEDEDAWSEASGTVEFDTRSGSVALQLTQVPKPPAGKSYHGWFDGIRLLTGEPVGTGALRIGEGGDLSLELSVKSVEGPRIEYFYTLGLAYFYMGECDRSYPLFDAALQIDPEEPNALEGVRLCQEADAER
jgi:tetratricopeptide (TPR) repeat protein